MTDIEKIEFTTTAFQCLVRGQQDRLRHGAILRQAMHDAVERGEMPAGYRPVWIQEMSRKLARVLGEEASRFDRTYVNDKASVTDLLDILATTMALFQEE
jgi:hypothetical protein